MTASDRQMFRRAGLVTRRPTPEVVTLAARVCEQLLAHGVSVDADPHCRELLASGPVGQRVGTLSGDVDLVIAIGGDGTMLSAVRAAAHMPRVRLLGIHLGRLGFLTDLTPADLPERLDRILDGEFAEDRRTMLACSVARDGETIATGEALNDVTIQKWNTARLIAVDTWLDGRFVHTQRADGVIVATPTGSTAYALSGGGPILHPAVPAFEVVPICPHTLTNRPLVISDDGALEFVLDIERPDYARVACDGVVTASLARGDRVRVVRSARSVTLVHPLDHDYFSTLRAKLHWGRELC